VQKTSPRTAVHEDASKPPVLSKTNSKEAARCYFVFRLNSRDRLSRSVGGLLENVCEYLQQIVALLAPYSSLREAKRRSNSASQTFSLVTTGLDPVVHADPPRNKQPAARSKPARCMDCRVKPGNDDGKGSFLSRLSEKRAVDQAANQFRLRSTSARCLIHGIISRSLAPTCSIECSASLARVALNEVWLTLFSNIQSRVKRPD
jgi:hypothetical protein